MSPKTAFETYLGQQNEESWAAALATLLRSIHEVDRNATQIWFAFYPLSLFRALQAAEDRKILARQLLLQGDYELKDQIDSSHHFLYGHRFWPEVKRAVEQYANEGVGDRVSGVETSNQNPERDPSTRLSSAQGVETAQDVSGSSSNSALANQDSVQHPTPNTQHPGSTPNTLHPTPYTLARHLTP